MNLAQYISKYSKSSHKKKCLGFFFYSSWGFFCHLNTHAWPVKSPDKGLKCLRVHMQNSPWCLITMARMPCHKSLSYLEKGSVLPVNLNYPARAEPPPLAITSHTNNSSASLTSEWLNIVNFCSNFLVWVTAFQWFASDESIEH